MTRKHAVRLAAGIGSILWMGVIFGLSSLPGSAVPGKFGTLGHFGLYLVLGSLYLLALPSAPPTGRALAIAVILASLYGISDEFHQSFTPGRVPDPVDWLVDTLGAIAGVVMITIIRSTAAKRG